MEELFGIPTERLMWILLAVFGAAVLILGLSALRNRVSFRMAARNLPRRGTQTILIVLGLMLATMLFSASFTTGDTLTNSLRVESLKNLGQVDVEVQARGSDSSGPQQFGPSTSERAKYFDAGIAGDVRDRLSDRDRVSGVAPAAIETVPVTATGSDLSEPSTDVLGLDQSSMQGFDSLESASGRTLDPSDLGKNEVYLSAEAARGLDVGKGDEVEATFAQKVDPTAVPNAPPEAPSEGFSKAPSDAGAIPETVPVPQPSKLTVAGVYESGANPASSASMVMPLERLQNRVGEEGRINIVLITHEGPAIDGAAGTDATISALRPLLEENDLKADPVKKDAIEQADSGGETFTSIFLLFGQFSVAAGVLLIFLIFVMLAAERKHELGIARAVGMRRGHLMRMFAFEG
ncbi:MAG TPA: ABC transporter permease, partial [Rubrobacter sp.]|nr:ABC transporter permease [Rubrobacter sp.]